MKKAKLKSFLMCGAFVAALSISSTAYAAAPSMPLGSDSYMDNTSSIDMLPDKYDDTLNYAFPNNKSFPFRAQIYEKGLFTMDIMALYPCIFTLKYPADSGELVTEKFAGKTHFKIFTASPGEITLTSEPVVKCDELSVEERKAEFFVTFSQIENLPVNVERQPVYRLFNPNNGEHFFTVDTKEVVLLIVAGWNYEGIAFREISDRNVIYHFYANGRHKYAYDYYKYDGVEGKAFGLPSNVHFIETSDGSDTLFTANDDEYIYLLNNGWVDSTIW